VGVNKPFKRPTVAEIRRLQAIEKAATAVVRHMDAKWIPWPALEALQRVVRTKPPAKKKPPA